MPASGLVILGFTSAQRWVRHRMCRGARGVSTKLERRADRLGLTGDLHGNAAIGGRAVAHLAGGVVAPAVGNPAGRNAAAVLTASHHGSEGQSAGDGYRRHSAVCGAVTDLAATVETPAVGAAARGETARATH